MSRNPFKADEKIRLRCEELSSSIGEEIQSDVRALFAGVRNGHVLNAEQCAMLIGKYKLADIDELMRVLLPVARPFALTPISDFNVGLVGLEAETGALIFGGNMEFSGTHMGLTVHGETCLAARAYSRGNTLAKIVLREAHPCGHCRQFLSEFAAAQDLRLIDVFGHDLGLADLLPWPFDPAYLGNPGAAPGTIHWPELALDLGGPVAEALLDAGQRAHAPYTNNPAAVAFAMKDGSHITGMSIESVAFNPSMGPMQCAIINLYAHDYRGEDIAEVHVAEVRNGQVNHAEQTKILAGSFAPGASVTVHHWI